MLLKRLISNKSILDFIIMFLSNIIKKGIGFVREIILASIFGSSILYANFLLLKTITDFFAQLTQGNALQASLLSKFSKLYDAEGKVSLVNVMSSSKQMVVKLFVLSQLIQLPIVWYINPESYLLFISVSVFLGFVVSINFYSSIFLLIMQGKGQFKEHSIATTVDMFISTVILYPLSILFGVLGIAISRVLGLLSMMYKYLSPMFKELGGVKVHFGIKDFNLSLMLLGNFANIIMLMSRFVAGLDDGNNITFYNYAVILLNTLLTAVILNLNTIVLRKLSIKKDVRLIFLSVGIALFLGLGLVYFIDVFGFETIQLIFQRGAFTLEDTISTTAYAKDLSISFIFIFIASALFQPYFTLNQNLIKRSSKNMALIFLFTPLVLFIVLQYMEYSARENSLIMIYVLSIVSMLMSFAASYKYFKLESNQTNIVE